MTCPTGKKPHATQADAVQFELENQKRFPDQERQYPYLCEQCGAHHLTSTPTGDTTLARVNYEEAALYNVTKQRRTVEEQIELQRKVIEMTQQGVPAKIIADRLDIDQATVYKLRAGRTVGGLKNTVEGIEAKQLSLKEQMAAIQAQIDAEEQRKKMIIEMRQLKVQWHEDETGERMLVITQDQNRFTLVADDALKLFELLQERLSEYSEKEVSVNHIDPSKSSSTSPPAVRRG